jgi:NAD(P)H dehydrogenase (quinone)
MWWFSMPAVMKGWVDRVFVMGASSEAATVSSTRLLSQEEAVLLVTKEWGGSMTGMLERHGR